MAHAGRPSKYNPEVMLPILEKATEEGWYLEMLPHALGITKETMHDWRNAQSPRYNEEFSDAIKKVQAARDARLMRLTMQIQHGTNPEGHFPSASMHIFALKNTVGWRDKSDLAVSVVDQEFEVGGEPADGGDEKTDA